MYGVSNEINQDYPLTLKGHPHTWQYLLPRFDLQAKTKHYRTLSPKKQNSCTRTGPYSIVSSKVSMSFFTMFFQILIKRSKCSISCSFQQYKVLKCQEGAIFSSLHDQNWDEQHCVPDMIIAVSFAKKVHSFTISAGHRSRVCTLKFRRC